MRVMREEVFGPLLPVLTWSDPQDVAAMVSAIKDQPLSLYLFSTDKKSVRYWLGATRSGTVGVGETVVQIANPDLLLGGVQASGSVPLQWPCPPLMNSPTGGASCASGFPFTAVPLSFPPFTPAKGALARWISRHL